MSLGSRPESVTDALQAARSHVGLNLVLQAGGNTGVTVDYASICFNGLQRRIQ